MNQIIELSWDSNFFGLKIGKLNFSDQNLDSLGETLKEAKNHGFKLIYLFGQPNTFLPNNVTLDLDCKLVDSKVLYGKVLTTNVADVRCRKLQSSDDLEFIYFLALESGQYSRYKLDKHFKGNDFERFYRTWVDNSISGKIADDFIVYEIENKILGFVTIKYNGNMSQIGLIAVSPLERSKGIGKTLIQYVEWASIENGCNSLTVATQEDNKEACRFYEKQEMHIVEKTKIYHIWL